MVAGAAQVAGVFPVASSSTEIRSYHDSRLQNETARDSRNTHKTNVLTVSHASDTQQSTALARRLSSDEHNGNDAELSQRPHSPVSPLEVLRRLSGGNLIYQRPGKLARALIGCPVDAGYGSFASIIIAGVHGCPYPGRRATRFSS